MAAMIMRVDDQEAALVREHASREGKAVSDFIRDAVFEKIEDLEDLAMLRSVITEDDGVRYTHEQVLSELLFSHH